MTALVHRSPNHALPIVAGAAAVACALAVVALLVVARSSQPAQPAVETAVEPRSFPAGVITYEVTGKGLFTADGGGHPIGTSNYEHLHAEGHVATAVEIAPSPDGSLIAKVVRDEAGVFLAVTDAQGAQRSLTQLASGDDPQLVAGGKGHARAVQGVPLVVAWSPDSKLLAFGSVTGEPYSLGLMRSPASLQPDVRYREVVGGYVGELAWSPDGSKLAISTYTIDRLSHSVLITDPGYGYAPRLLDGCHVTWSPDSAYLAVHRDPGAEPGAWVVSATDAAERWAITREVQAFPLTWLEG
jgi:hypothetical protein